MEFRVRGSNSSLFFNGHLMGSIQFAWGDPFSRMGRKMIAQVRGSFEPLNRGLGFKVWGSGLARWHYFSTGVLMGAVPRL